jgi:hypothetical protein
VKRFLALPLAAVIAASAMACSTAGDTMCQASAGARVCLNAAGGGGFDVTGSGVQPGSAVHVRVPGPGLPFIPLKADASGKFPDNGVAVVTEGATPIDIPVDVTTSAGAPLTLTFHLPAASR